MANYFEAQTELDEVALNSASASLSYLRHLSPASSCRSGSERSVAATSHPNRSTVERLQKKAV
jgi:hypothetical protein